MKVSELITALEEFEAKLTAHEDLLAKRAGQRAELSEAEKQAALAEQSRWLSRRLGALRPYIERFDNEWLMQHPATRVTWDALEIGTSLTGHPGKKSSLRHVLPKLQQILGRLETLDPDEEIAASGRHSLSANDETRSERLFEREVASIFRALGAEVEHDVALLGMQIDLVTRERTPSGGVITSAVECKYYSRPAGIEVVNQFATVALLLRAKGQIDRAIIVALSGFTRPAREAARSHNIQLLELDDLKQRLTKVKPEELKQAREEVEAQEVTDKKRQKPRIFVVMPFAAEFQDVYILGIREVAEKLGFVIERADDIEHNNSIVEIIQERIKDCDAIIADTTGRNPNVFYEVGYAHALGKPTILIAHKGETLPFDVRSINFIIYENIVELRQRLEKRIKGTGLQVKRADWKSQVSEPAATTVTPSLDNTIGFGCAWSAPPTHYREEKTLFIVDFQGVPITGINPNQQVAGPMSFRRSTDPFKASDHYSETWYRCDITNYGTEAVRNIRMHFPVEFLEVEPTETGTRSGKVLASGYALTPSIDLGVGSAGSDYFYFANGSDVIIRVGVPTVCNLQRLTDLQPRTVKLIPPSHGKGPFILPPSQNPIHPRNPASNTDSQEAKPKGG